MTSRKLKLTTPQLKSGISSNKCRSQLDRRVSAVQLEVCQIKFTYFHMSLYFDGHQFEMHFG